MEVPPILAELPNWVLWSADKIPLQSNGKPAKSNDPTTWNTLANVLAVADQFGNRIGFMFRAADGLVGIDLDGAVCDGAIAPWALRIVKAMDCYSEFSPSGKGIHIICQGGLPDGRGRKTKLIEPATSDKQPGIEIYSNGRYFTFTGDAIGGEVVPAGDALRRLLADYWPATIPQAKAPVAISERVRRYMQTIPPAVSGQGGHNRTLWAARCLVTGFQLSAEDATSHLAEWNLGCLPPWSERELAHKIESAIGTQCDKPAGWLLTEREPSYQSSVVLDLTLPRAVESAESDEPPPPELRRFPTRCLAAPGLIGEIVAFTLATAIYPQPELALAGALAMMSLITGRKICDRRNTRTNLQITTLGPTRSGKEHPRTVNEGILRAVGCPGLYEEASASAAALHGFMQEQDGVGMMQWDEFGDFLALARSKSGGNTQAAQMVTAMTKMYSASKCVYKAARYADNKKQVVIDQPHFVLFASSAPEIFWRHVTSDYLAGGFMGRMLLFPGRGAVLPNSDAAPGAEIPAAITNQVTQWLAFPGDVVPGNLKTAKARVVPHTPEAWARYVEHEFKIAKARIKEDSVRAAMWGGTAENTAKLALLFACSRVGFFGLEITLADVDLAIALSNWLTEQKVDSTGKNVAETQSEKDYALIDRITLAAGVKGIAAWSLNRKLRSIQPYLRDRYLLDLLTNHDLDIVESATGGTPQKMYRHVAFRSKPIAKP